MSRNPVARNVNQVHRPSRIERKEATTRVCPTCKGEGEIGIVRLGCLYLYTTDCPSCNGAGVLYD